MDISCMVHIRPVIYIYVYMCIWMYEYKYGYIDIDICIKGCMDICIYDYRVSPKKGNNAFQESYSILLSSQELYLCSQKTEASPVVLHIITFHSSKYCLIYIKLIFMIVHIEVYFYSNSWIFLWSLFYGFETRFT